MTTTMTITEGLAEIKTIIKRIDKKRANVNEHLWRQEALKDPLEKSGGSVAFINQELQSVGDLEKRYVRIRAAISNINSTTMLALGGTVMSVSDWLVWRRDIAPRRQVFMRDMANRLSAMRSQAAQKQLSVVAATEEGRSLASVVVNIDEAELARERDEIENVLGMLDGKLSLLNATTQITVED